MEWLFLLVVSGIIASYSYGVGDRFGRRMAAYMIHEDRRQRLTRK